MKPEREFFDSSDRPFEPLGVEGLYQKILVDDPESGGFTRLLKFEPGTDTSPNGVLTHDVWEEVWILEGFLYDIPLDETFGVGMFACRPPGMEHGPWKAPEGCLTFEVRYPDPDSSA